MKFTLLSSQDKKIFDVVWVEVTTSAGNFVFQKGHVPMMLVLTPGEPIIFELQKGMQESLVIKGGIIHVKRDHITVVLKA